LTFKTKDQHDSQEAKTDVKVIRHSTDMLIIRLKLTAVAVKRTVTKMHSMTQFDLTLDSALDTKAKDWILRTRPRPRTFNLSLGSP